MCITRIFLDKMFKYSSNHIKQLELKLKRKEKDTPFVFTYWFIKSKRDGIQCSMRAKSKTIGNIMVRQVF